MPPILSFLLGLTALIPHVLSLSIPANPSNGLHIIGTPSNPWPPPIPPLDPSYHIPGTTKTLNLIGPLDLAPLPPLAALACVEAAQNDIRATIASLGHDPLLPRTGWRFVENSIRLTADAPFPRIGSYSQLDTALTGLRFFLANPTGPGCRELEWALFDSASGLGLLFRGSIEPATRLGLGANATATATATATPHITGVAGYRDLVDETS